MKHGMLSFYHWCHRNLAWLLLLIYALLVFLPGIFALPITDRDEAGYVEATREMVLNQQYWLMTVGGDPLHDPKPVGIHWLQVPFVWLFDAADSNQAVWVYRLVSLLGALVSVLSTYLIGRKLFDTRTAWIGAFAYASCLCLMIESTLAKTDAALQASVTLAMLAALHLAMGMITKEKNDRLVFVRQNTTRIYAGLFWFMLAVGVLMSVSLVKSLKEDQPA